MILDLIDLALDVTGDLAQVDLLIRFGWPCARAGLRRGWSRLARLGFASLVAAFVRSDAELEEDARADADAQLLGLLRARGWHA